MSRRKPQFLDDTEPEALLKATSTERDRLVCMLMLYAGLRVSEVVKLLVEHLDFRRRLLWVREGKGGKDRCLPLPARLCGPLRGFVGPRRGHVFPSPYGGLLTTRALQKLVKRLAVKAGLPGATDPRKFHPHALRHSFCTRLLDAGVPIQQVRDLMGHSSIGVTDTYAHSSPTLLREAIDKPYA